MFDTSSGTTSGTSANAPASAAPSASTNPTAPRYSSPRQGPRFVLAHPAHAIALGLGSGLSPWAPGTVGTLWAWLTFWALDPVLSDRAWGAVIAASLLLGWWACTVTARHLGTVDPSAVVWDEVVAFWLILWLWTPASFWQQLAAFAVFRFFDAAKPGPVGWADAVFKRPRAASREPAVGWAQGFGILFDDLVAALCTLLVLAVAQSLVVWAGWQAGG